MRNIHIVCLSVLAVLGCQSHDANPETSRQQLNPSAGTTANTVDQGETSADREISQRVREAVMKHDELSSNAQNVRISTRDGVVTLRGPVASEQEKAALVQAANTTTGVKRVDAEVEVTKRLSAAQGSSTPSPSMPSADQASRPRAGSTSAPRQE